MKSLLLLAAAMILAAPGASAQPGGQSAAPVPLAKSADQGAGKPKKAKAAVEDYTPQASEYGKKVKCPVEGDSFKVGPDTKAVRYKGKTYYFCCGGCLPRFKKNPARYAK
jgi:YHS domain-containing protein